MRFECENFGLCYVLLMATDGTCSLMVSIEKRARRVEIVWLCFEVERYVCLHFSQLNVALFINFVP